MYGGVFSSPDANKFLKIQPIIGFFTSWFQPIPKNDPKLFMADAISSTIISNTAPTSKFQINVDKIIITPIPREAYNEIIDGRSITFTVPQLSGVTGISAKTIVSSTNN